MRAADLWINFDSVGKRLFKHIGPTFLSRIIVSLKSIALDTLPQFHSPLLLTTKDLFKTNRI